MDEKKPVVSDEAKAAAAKRTAEAKKAAEAKKTGSVTKAAPKKAAPDGAGKPAVKAPAKKAAPKDHAPDARDQEPEEQAEEAVEEVREEKPAKKAKLEVSQTSEQRKSVKGLRIGAIVLWVLAFACEVGAFFALHYMALNKVTSWTQTESLLFIGAIVLDAVLCIIAAQLWKKSNRISPCLADSKFVRTLWHQLGVIMALVCLVPIGIILLIKSKDMNKQLKTILLIVFAALLAATTTASVDYKQPTEEEVEQLQQEAEAASPESVYWTTFGKSYHFDPNCRYIAGKTLVEDGGTLHHGSLDDAFNANRWDPCDACAGGAEAKAAETQTELPEAAETELEPAA